MTPRAWAWIVSALAMTAGCGSKSGSPDGSMTSSDLAGADLSSDSTDMAGGSTGGDGFVATDNRLFPLVVGHRWNYSITPKTSTPTCTATTDFTEVTAQTASGAVNRFDVKLNCFGASQLGQGNTDETFIYLSVSGPPKPYTLIGVPVQEGATYTYTETRTWHSLGTYAGYADCWKSQPPQTFAYQIYCRGVGMVEDSEQSWVATLVDKNF